MEKKSPFFSIIIPCFNHGHFLSSSIGSILNQKFEDFEIILINDGSTDDTKSIGEDFCKKDSRIRLIDQKNLGLSQARNSGIKNANGTYINFLDADDWLMPNTLTCISKEIKEKEFDFCLGGFAYFLNGEELHTTTFPKSEISADTIFLSNVAPPGAFFIRRTVIDQIGYFDSSLKSCEDWDYWIRVAKGGFTLNSINHVVLGYRYLFTSMSRNPLQMFEALVDVGQRARSIQETNNKNQKGRPSQSIKISFLKCLGVLLMQGKIKESSEWLNQEKIKHNFVIDLQDWRYISSNLSFKYFLKGEYLNLIFSKIIPFVIDFFERIGYSKNEIKYLKKLIFEGQIRQKNILKYGPLFGRTLNYINYWKRD